MYAEDIDLCLRFIEHGWRVRYWPGVDVIHVGSGSNEDGRRPAEADSAYFRTMAPFIRKHRPGLRGTALAGGVWVVGRGRPSPRHACAPAGARGPAPAPGAPARGRCRRWSRRG